MKKKGLLSFVIATVTLCSSLLFGCNVGEDPKPTLPGLEEWDPAEQYRAEVKDLNGHEFVFIVRGTNPTSHLSTHAVYAEAPNGDKVNDAVFARNAQLADRYNCTIREKRVNDPGTETRESLMAGDYVADFIMGTATQLKSLTCGNLLSDLSKVTTLDQQKAWWDQEAICGTNLGSKIYFLTGDGATLDDRSAWILYYNQDVIREWNPEFNLVQTVKNGEWTLDLMAKIMAETARDNGDGKVDSYTQDRVGLTAERASNWHLIAGCNVHLSDHNDQGSYSLSDQIKPEVLAAWEAAKGVLASPVRYISDVGTYFRKGFSTFYIANVGTMLSSSQATVQVGFLPFPKLNREQEHYHTTVSYSQFGVYCIPATVEQAKDWRVNGFSSGTEQAAYFLEAFSYYSRLIVTPAFYQQVLLKQAALTEETEEMLKLALSHKIYDPVVGLSFGMDVFASAGCPDGEKWGSDLNYASLQTLYAERLEQGRQALAAYVEYVNSPNVLN